MAGKIIADQIEHSTAGSLDTSYVVNGSAKAWANYAGSGTTFRDSFNCSSALDNGTGDYTVTISNAMGNNFYAITSHTQRNASTSENLYCSSYQNNYDTAHTTGSFRVATNRPDNASHEDALAVMLSVSGDLA